jgi:hypothetical protein
MEDDRKIYRKRTGRRRDGQHNRKEEDRKRNIETGRRYDDKQQEEDIDRKRA